MANLTLSELELELITLLRAQGLPVAEIYLVGVLGQGTRASVFSVMIDGVYHILKVYDSKESLRAELKNLKKMTPKDRFLLSWNEQSGGSKYNLLVVEVPEGQALNASHLTDRNISVLSQRLVELHRIRYRQKVSVTALQDQFDRQCPIALEHLRQIDYRLEEFEQLLEQLTSRLHHDKDLLRTNKVRIHGDLGWTNLVVAAEGPYVIDWESLRRADAAEDLSKLRLSLFFPGDGAFSVWFWQQPDHTTQAQALFKTLVAHHSEALLDKGLVERLRFYLPLQAVEILANRYIFGNTNHPIDSAINCLIVDQALALAADPLAPPPDLSNHGYWGLIEKSRAVTAND